MPTERTTSLAAISLACLALMPVATAAQVATTSVDPEIQSVLANVVATGKKPAGKLPGIVAGIQRDGEPMRIAAAGVRKWGSQDAMEITDQIHIGSCTKAMTATLIAKLVDQGKLQWDTKLSAALPELAASLHADYQDVTIRDLLLHRSGLPANADNWWGKKGKDVTQQRLEFARQHLSQPAKQKRGDYLYSNLGYMVAGLAAGQVTGKSWEDLMRDEVFAPLAITSGGFGPPGTSGQVDQPWGHLGPALMPLQRDNAPALGPAGTVHLSLEDWAKFTQQHCGGALNTLISAESMTELQRPHGEGANGNYALGWMVVQRPWGNGTVLTHSGSNTMWFATVWVAPEKKTSYLVATNYAGGKTGQIVDKVIGALIAIDNDQDPPEIAISGPPSAAKLSDAQLESFVGEYDYGQLGKLIIKREGDRLLAKLTGQTFLEVVPTSENVLSWVDVDAQLECERDDSGAIVKATHKQGGQALPVKKIK